ncbi:hypothetical protein SAMN05216474_0559 [Lishizhenia tianjinensis]|uniref:Uncharacterized protein n=1 Tax=Lishizhenia tianjinensis TaxID=477690 RepID=A0A1I6Y036_9FLAO|nr:hypothetical protein [Lishizhenia tianjinensis]SFT43672.1 hypothetical protein SAMN05216474_0559 [Lishizhenia tianjinensis]
MKFFLLFVFILSVTQSALSNKNSSIQVTTFIIIEKDALDAEEIGLLFENTEYGFTFKFTELMKANGYFLNQNIYAYSQQVHLNKELNVKVNFQTQDTVSNFSESLFLNSNLSSVTINCFIKKNERGLSRLTNIEVEKIVNNPEDIYLEKINNPEYPNQYIFQLINKTTDTLYPASYFNTVSNGKLCASSFFGKTSKFKSYGYIHVSGYSFCDSLDNTMRELLPPHESTLCFSLGEQNCSPYNHKDQGKYAFYLNVSKSPSYFRKNESSIFSFKDVFHLFQFYELK